jgi:anti-sigma factor RsiW
MTCHDLIDFLIDYFSGSLPEETLRTFEAHLARCPPCVAYLETYRETIRLSKEACHCPEAGTREEIPEELVRAILASVGKSRCHE